METKSLPVINHFTQSDEYRSTIHRLIPGGAHTYSKGDDQFPTLSPAAITHGKGAYCWDVDGNKFLDTLMGLTSVSLGHAFDEVNERVIQEIHKGVNFSRPSIIEREMAEKFLSLVPQHDMIKYAKTAVYAQQLRSSWLVPILAERWSLAPSIIHSTVMTIGSLEVQLAMQESQTNSNN